MTKKYLLFFILFFATRVSAEPLIIYATVPELAEIVKQIGAQEVIVESFASPGEDPHFVQAKPSFIKKLSIADAFVYVGLDLELGWAPTLVSGSRNLKIKYGEDGDIDCSKAVKALGVIDQGVDRSMGDLHEKGNPHYLLDPVNGIEVAKYLASRLSKLRPASKELFFSNFNKFRKQLGEALIGRELFKKYEIEKLMELDNYGKLEEFLTKENDLNKLTGWLKTAKSIKGMTYIADHDLWPYFAKRYGLIYVDSLEPKPGIPPTTKHLASIISKMRKENVKLIFSTPYYDSRHALFVSENTEAQIIKMAHQVGSRKKALTYFDLCNYNIQELVDNSKK
jgi:zinc/manganese transport system substrate-binding protein